MMSREYAIPAGFSLVFHLILLVWIAQDFTHESEKLEVIIPPHMNATLVELDPKNPPKPKKSKVEKPKLAVPKPEVPKPQVPKPEILKKAEPEPPVTPSKIDPNIKAAELKKQKEVELKRIEEKRKKDEALLAEEKIRKEAAERRADQLLSSIEDEELLQESNQKEESAISYIAFIAEMIKNKWSRPPSARNGMEVLLDIELIPTGEVRNVNIVKSSGDQAFDRSAVSAVEKAAPFDKLADLEPKVFEKNFRHFKMTFRPEDLRL